MDITRVDSRTAVTDFSWKRALVVSGVIWFGWTALTLVIGVLHHGYDGTAPSVGLAIVLAAAYEQDRRDRARRAVSRPRG